jgi:hypothetical protein
MLARILARGVKVHYHSMFQLGQIVGLGCDLCFYMQVVSNSFVAWTWNEGKFAQIYYQSSQHVDL